MLSTPEWIEKHHRYKVEAKFGDIVNHWAMVDWVYNNAGEFYVDWNYYVDFAKNTKIHCFKSKSSALYFMFVWA